PRAQWRYALIAGTLLFVQISLFNVGVLLSNSSHGSLLINTGVFGVVALEHFVTRQDRLTPQRWAGLFIAAAGVVTILLVTSKPAQESQLDQPSLLGDLILLVSASILAVKIVYIKHAVRYVSPSKL